MPSQMLELLAMLLGSPDEDSLTFLREMLVEHPWMNPAVEELAGVPLEHWQAEHTRLFINGYPRTPCVPFESFFRHGRMGGVACQEMESLYSYAGLAPTEAVPADYLGTMLSFATWLREHDAPEYPPLLEELKQKHLAQWLPEFGTALIDNARLELYRLMGEKLRDSLEHLQ